jgi:hypothetical protein
LDLLIITSPPDALNFIPNEEREKIGSKKLSSAQNSVKMAL